jgi:sodium transport system permease protein
MLPAIDLFAGEKERGTIETLLTSPVNRAQILIGKMIVVTTIGLMSATIALIGLFVSLNMLDADSELMSAINQILSPKLILTLYLLLVPLAFFFAGVMIPISVYSRSYKEAQSILTPLNIVMVLPAMAGFFPGVELDYTTAFIPIVNVVLATKAIIAGNADMVLIAITFISLILLAALSIVIAMKQFGKESMVLR